MTIHVHLTELKMFHNVGDKTTTSQQGRKSTTKDTVSSGVPSPLPLVCPGQHLHKVLSKYVIDDGKSPLEDPTTFSLGRLRVILVDGVVYR